MKNLIFVLLFLANSIIVNAQFNSRSYIANVLTPGKNHELRLGDVDNDNDLDYVSMTDEGDIYWFENVDSLANYFKPYLVAVAITPSDMSHVDLFDVDNDGDLDVVALDILNNKLYTYLNDLNATGKFLNFIFSDISYVGSNYLSRTDISDVNGDGKEDIIINGNTGLSWIKNLGNGLFDQPQTISTNIKTFDSIDFDNDGDIDFIQIESGSGADWLENDGVGNFIAHNIPNMVGRSILITDFDGDNFLDVLTTSYDTQSRIYWYEQVNDTVFTQQLLYSL
ncbi:MAG: VCBS repeat-containing protein, partial [Flavobacteriales bacterium]|nr:VCBS repeat-containing protein [Flavobacteriales bacterium]